MEFVQTFKLFGHAYVFEFRYGPHHGGEIGIWCRECPNRVELIDSIVAHISTIKSAYSKKKDQGLLNLLLEWSSHYQCYFFRKSSFVRQKSDDKTMINDVKFVETES